MPTRHLQHRRQSFLHAASRVRARTARRVEGAIDRLLGDDALERLGRISYHPGDGGTDPFGFDPQVARYAMVGARWLYREWFRAEVTGIEHVPEGRLLLIANHSGQLPFDAMAIACAMLLDRDPPRFVRSMVEKWTATLPFVSTLFPRLGQIVGVPENCARLLEMEEVILVFPEGSKGISKPFARRYQLGDFGLGFMRLALATGTPIVPVSVVGAEEQYINVTELSGIADLLGMPTFPVIPQWLVPGGLMPLPVKYRLRFGPAMHFTGDPDDEDAVIEEKVSRVRATVQSMVNRGLKERRGIFR